MDELRTEEYPMRIKAFKRSAIVRVGRRSIGLFRIKTGHAVSFSKLLTSNCEPEYVDAASLIDCPANGGSPFVGLLYGLAHPVATSVNIRPSVSRYIKEGSHRLAVFIFAMVILAGDNFAGQASKATS